MSSSPSKQLKGKCEKCGKYAELLWHNGYYVCDDCRRTERRIKEAPLHYKVEVKKLDGVNIKWEFCELSILKVKKNEVFFCPTHCYYYEKEEECFTKKDLMINPVKNKLVCTTVLMEVLSNLPSSEGYLTIKGRGEIKLLDSSNKSYSGFLQTCSELYNEVKRRYGYVSRGFSSLHSSDVAIDEATRATFLLTFPEIPSKENVLGIIIPVYSSKTGVLQTFDIRLKK